MTYWCMHSLLTFILFFFLIYSLYILLTGPLLVTYPHPLNPIPFSSEWVALTWYFPILAL